ncbi:ABC transporter permease, partial [Serratia sp. CY81166]|uniref:ABC transporter permease n=1 Tax=Serratia sp. CY81166 TaxID=3383683 RepID=UPI003FA152E9
GAGLVQLDRDHHPDRRGGRGAAVPGGLMYLSPIFYPISMLPDAYHIFMQLSPLTYVIEQARDCMMLGKNIAWGSWGIYTLISFVIMLLGYGWFMFTRKGFADVI